MTEHKGSTSLFAIFLLSLYSLFLFPYTIYRVFGGGSEETVVQPYVQVGSPAQAPATGCTSQEPKLDCLSRGAWCSSSPQLHRVNRRRVRRRAICASCSIRVRARGSGGVGWVQDCCSVL